MRQTNWKTSLVLAFVSSTALYTMLAHVDSNGFDYRKDIPKIAIVLITVFCQWLRNYLGGTAE